MFAILKQFRPEKNGFLALAFPLALISFIMAATSYSLPVAGTTGDWAGNPRIVDLTDQSPLSRMVQLKGSLIARSHDNTVTDLVLTVANTAGSEPIDLAANSFVVSYHDQHQRVTNLPWTWRFQGKDDGDKILESEELLQLTIRLSATPQVKLDANTPFVIELSPPQGAALTIQRTTPRQLDPIVDLDS
jgi:hypothetical protein